MKKMYLLLGILVFMSSCCEKDVYLDPDVVDEVVGVYQSIGSYYGIEGYRIKVIKISADTVKITPYIGNEMRTYTASFRKILPTGVKEFLADDTSPVYFYVNESIIKLNSKVLPEYYGYKIE